MTNVSSELPRLPNEPGSERPPGRILSAASERLL